MPTSLKQNWVKCSERKLKSSKGDEMIVINISSIKLESENYSSVFYIYGSTPGAFSGGTMWLLPFKGRFLYRNTDTCVGRQGEAQQVGAHFLIRTIVTWRNMKIHAYIWRDYLALCTNIFGILCNVWMIKWHIVQDCAALEQVYDLIPISPGYLLITSDVLWRTPVVNLQPQLCILCRHKRSFHLICWSGFLPISKLEGCHL